MRLVISFRWRKAFIGIILLSKFLVDPVALNCASPASSDHTFQLIDGRSEAKKLRQLVASEIEHLKRHQCTPKLAAICIGDDPASQIYLKVKSEQAQQVGMDIEVIRQPASISHQDLEQLIIQFNQDPKVSGILLQLPLPPSFDPNYFVNLIDAQKDVDGLTRTNVGAFLSNSNVL